MSLVHISNALLLFGIIDWEGPFDFCDYCDAIPTRARHLLVIYLSPTLGSSFWEISGLQIVGGGWNLKLSIPFRQMLPAFIDYIFLALFPAPYNFGQMLLQRCNFMSCFVIFKERTTKHLKIRFMWRKWLSLSSSKNPYYVFNSKAFVYIAWIHFYYNFSWHEIAKLFTILYIHLSLVSSEES